MLLKLFLLRNVENKIKDSLFMVFYFNDELIYLYLFYSYLFKQSQKYMIVVIVIWFVNENKNYVDISEIDSEILKFFSQGRIFRIWLYIGSKGCTVFP